MVVLCLACVASFAQTKRKTTKRKTPAKKVAAAPVAQSSTVLDTTPKVAVSAEPPKPFDRPLDGYYKKDNIAHARVTPYANLREADVVFAKRVWRDIDVREKMNQYMASPKARLIDILMEAVKAGELTAYSAVPTKDDPNGDSFALPLASDKAISTMVDSALVDKFDKVTGEKISSSMQAGEFNPDSLVRYRIKEDWVFDKQRSVFEPRIIGIAPLIKDKVAGLNLDYRPAFWIYFPAARQLLATKEAFNRSNDATSLSFDDAFLKRIFTSVIVKVSNDKDERIKDYTPDSMDRLYEAERIKKELMDWELNLWQY